MQTILTFDIPSSIEKSIGYLSSQDAWCPSNKDSFIDRKTHLEEQFIPSFE